MLSEISMSAGHAVCVAMTSPKPSTVLDRDRDLMVPSALASGAGSSTTSPTRSFNFVLSHYFIAELFGIIGWSGHQAFELEEEPTS